MRRIIQLAAVWVALMGLAACLGLGSLPATSYFRLVGPSQCPPQPGSYPYVVAILPFRAPAVYQQTALLYRPSPFEVAFYGSSRWEAMPSEMLFERVRDYLEECRLFRQVTRYGLSSRPDLLLRSRITSFEEVDSPEGTWAELGLEAELLCPQSAQLVWQGRLAARSPMNERSPQELARAMSASLASVLGEMAQKLGPAVGRLEGRGCGESGSR